MTAPAPRYPMEEFARKGDEMYDRVVQPQLSPADDNKLVAVDIESGTFEIDRDGYTAIKRLLARLPDAQIWLVRVGHPAAYHIGRGRGSEGTT